jgi:hypothetical protein
MLTAARDYVRERGLTSLRDVALHLGVSEDVAAALLQKWVDKGRIDRVTAVPRCSACDLCGSAAASLYRWTGPPDLARADHREGGRSMRVPSDCPAGPSQGQG